ncbi:Uncharacterised protein [Leclercia adecarboxylata]|uniref:Transcription elongation factor GreB n=1 Tax=Leclercia adecarboxylata TaxID=83655 RepID=A0A4U9IZL5_9ENTR|nr:Uncharacterised protein [Leclercia adecarboxylata]
MKTPLITREGYENLKKEMDTAVAGRAPGGDEKSDLGCEPG